MAKLKNERHEMFCREYLVDLNATQSYKRVYKCSENVANKNGPKLLVNIGVRQRISELKEKRVKKLDRTADDVLRDIEEIKRKCMEDENYDPKSALKALELEGKHKAMWTDKVKHTGDVTVSIDQLIKDAKNGKPAE